MRIAPISQVGTTNKKVSKQQTAPNFKKLLEVKFLDRFNPNCSESAYKLFKIFKSDSWAMKTLFDLYDVKAAIKTSWYEVHPHSPATPNYKEFSASYTQLDLFIKAIKPSLLVGDGIHWEKISIGEYSNYKSFNPLSSIRTKKTSVRIFYKSKRTS